MDFDVDLRALKELHQQLGRFLEAALAMEQGNSQELAKAVQHVQEQFMPTDAFLRAPDLLKHLLEAVPVAVVMVSGDNFRFTLINPAAEVRFKPFSEKALGQPFAEVWPQAAKTVLPDLQRVFATGKPLRRLDLPTTLLDQEIFLTISYTPLLNSHGTVNSILIIAEETTARVLRDRERETERLRLQTLVENAPLGILVTDESGRLVLANEAARRIIQIPINPGEDFRNPKFFTVHYPSGQVYPYEQLPVMRSLRYGETVSNYEFHWHRNENDRRILLGNSAPLRDANGRITGAVLAFQDVTEMRQTEQERLQTAARLEVQHRLARQREMERVQIARDIHDSPIQSLTALKFSTEQARQRVEGDPTLEALMSHLDAGLAKTVQELRDLCNELRPPSLAPYGLEKAIRSHAREFRARQPGLLIELDLDADQLLLAEETRLALFRIYQEALNNIVKHAEADEVRVVFRMRPPCAELTISDNGKGFTQPDDWVNLVRDNHFGLVGMRERIEAVSGLLQVRSTVGQGTSISARVPLDMDGSEQTHKPCAPRKRG